MEIAVNTRLLIKGQLGGMAWFTLQTMKRITQQHPEHHFYFLFDRPPHPDFVFAKNVTPIVLFPPARHPILWYIWFEWSVARFLRKVKPDLFISPDGYLPLKTRTPTLAVIHDINFHYISGNLPVMVLKYYQHFFPKFAMKADRIATVSNYSKKDLVESYGLSAEKIDVVYNGSDPMFKPLNPEEQKAVRDYYCSGSEFFVFISSLHPRKNMCRTLEAFDLFKKRTGLSHKLIMVGARFFKTKKMRQVHARMTHKEEVIFLGRMERPEISKILGSALALIYVPLYEGFGIPLLEGFRCDTPVIAGNRTSLPEVGGDAALYVDPYSPESISEGMIRLVNHPELQKELVKKGQMRKDLFTWDRTAQLLCESINKTADTKPCHVGR